MKNSVKIDKETMDKIMSAANRTWNEVSMDAYSMMQEIGEELTAAHAAEFVFDADRIETIGGLDDEASKILDNYIGQVGWPEFVKSTKDWFVV